MVFPSDSLSSNVLDSVAEYGAPVTTVRNWPGPNPPPIIPGPPWPRPIPPGPGCARAAPAVASATENVSAYFFIYPLSLLNLKIELGRVQKTNRPGNAILPDQHVGWERVVESRNGQPHSPQRGRTEFRA